MQNDILGEFLFFGKKGVFVCSVLKLHVVAPPKLQT